MLNKNHNRTASDYLFNEKSNALKETTNLELIDRAMSRRKEVSFNKDIDVRIFRKDSKNLKLIESYLQPLSVQPLLEQQKFNKDDSTKSLEQKPNGNKIFSITLLIK